MASSVPLPEKALKTLQQLIRQKARSGEPTAMRIQIPTEMAGEEAQSLPLIRQQVTAVGTAETALLADLRFEYLRKPKDQLWQFVAECWTDRQADHVAAFIEHHAKEPTGQTCYFPIEYLTAPKVIEVGGVRFLPAGDPELPPTSPWFVLEAPVGCVAAASVRGTNSALMARRARPAVEHALRLLRVALSQVVGDSQVRFRPGTGYAFHDGTSGWQRRDDVAVGIELLEDMTSFLSQPVARVPASPSNEIGKKALLALEWLERAYLTGDMLLATLYRFFAMEALIGDTSEKLKSYRLALREMTLSYMVIGGFRFPNSTLFLYDKVRSGAVHGEQVPEVTKAVADKLEWAARDVLNQYLTVAEQHDITRRGDLVRMLDQHPDRPKLLAWLRQHGGSGWTRYLNQIEAGPC